MRNPFSSISYICRGSTRYCLIFLIKSSKYSVYLKAESALERLWSKPIDHFETRSTVWRFRKPETHSFPISLPQISLAKFRIICLLGGKARAHKRSIYLTRDFSCWSLRFRWFWYWVSRLPARPRNRLDRKERSHPNSLAVFDILGHSPGCKEANEAKAASIGSILRQI